MMVKPLTFVPGGRFVRAWLIVKGRLTEGNVTFRSSLNQPGWMPVPELACQARLPTLPFGPIAAVPPGPVCKRPLMLALPIPAALARPETVETSPLSLILVALLV